MGLKDLSEALSPVRPRPYKGGRRVSLNVEFKVHRPFPLQ